MQWQIQSIYTPFTMEDFLCNDYLANETIKTINIYPLYNGRFSMQWQITDVNEQVSFTPFTMEDLDFSCD